MVSHYLKFDLLKCKIITSKGSSLHQQFHIYDVAEESDLVCLSAPAIKEEKKYLTGHSYQTFYFVKVYLYIYFFSKKQNSLAWVTSWKWLSCEFTSVDPPEFQRIKYNRVQYMGKKKRSVWKRACVSAILWKILTSDFWTWHEFPYLFSKLNGKNQLHLPTILIVGSRIRKSLIQLHS